MFLDREKAVRAFNEYVEKYNSKDRKIKLKIDHTFRVTGICEEIARKLRMSDKDVDLAFFMGLLHDIGRFEQIKRYGTFDDSKSIDHAALAVEILFEEGKIRDFVEDDDEDELIMKAIRCHSAFAIPDNYNKREKTFSYLLRDADKIDIFKVSYEERPEDAFGVTHEQLTTSEISNGVMAAIKNHETVLSSIRSTPLDNIISRVALVFGIYYRESLDITEKQGYLSKLMEFKSENEETKNKIKEIKDIVRDYLKK
ncbi:MAG: HD domain-containing protein [Clostridiaceae bacterium]|nr:HD domain-containing protein [Clostridiaceae bacterium]